jgi:fructose/tagatose bisphosphate aldolase
MADIRTQLTSEDGSDNLFPISKAVNIMTNSGTNVEGELGTLKQNDETMNTSVQNAVVTANQAKDSVAELNVNVGKLTNRITTLESTVSNLDGIRYVEV